MFSPRREVETAARHEAAFGLSRRSDTVGRVVGASLGAMQRLARFSFTIDKEQESRRQTWIAGVPSSQHEAPRMLAKVSSAEAAPGCSGTYEPETNDIIA